LISLPEGAQLWFSSNQYIESTLFSLLFSILFLTIHHTAERREIGRMSFGKIILIKSILYIIGFAIIFLFIYVLMVLILNAYSEVELASYSFTTSTFVSVFSYLTIVFLQIVFLNFIIQASKTFGHSNLLNFISGKYHKPLIEERVFLFIDLKDSTTYAEKLGNIKYSMLIKNCFDDLNRLIVPYKAEIYQYVGDEAVLTWLSSEMKTKTYCIDFYFAYLHLLESRSAFYIKEYGFVPKFKAGANGGIVTATEIGDIKRDIAYHGDVLNTASRIQGKCNEFNAQFLIEADLFAKLDSSGVYSSEFIKDVKLKGKVGGTDLFSLKEV